MMENKTNEIILELLKEKSSLKQDVFYSTLSVFKELKDVVKEVVNDLKPKVAAIDKRLIINYKDKTEFEIELQVAGDVLIFQMHTNVFEFDISHQIWKTSYVKEQPSNSFCGVINIYNFLADSFKYNRSNDLGYLVARIFQNRENHYFVEGKRQLGFLYNDFSNALMNRAELKKIVESAVVYCLSFDLFTPPFEEVRVVSVGQTEQQNFLMSVKTGKRLGFRFQTDTDELD
jgi:hypothetical protein